MLAVLVVALLAGSCGLADDEPEAAQAAPTTVELLPPAETEPTATAEVEPAAAPTAIEISTTPTPIPAPSTLSCLSTRARVAQLLLPLATQPELFGAQAFAADGEIGGIGLLGQPDAQIADDLAALQQASFVPLLIASDEEGGSVQRLASLLGPISSAAVSAQSKSPEDVRNEWREYGFRVADLGIDVIFGPVLDVGSGPGIESRSFSDDPQVVADYGRAVADGLIEAGLMPVFKHFPGHGQATADSHLELPTTPSLDELRSSDLLPYVQLLSEPNYSGQAAVMVGHLSVPGLSDEVPTSLSPETVNGLLRAELGFGGIVFTDAMNMGAIVNTYGVLEAIELAILAGADIAILGSLADVTPTLDYLTMRAEEDIAFAQIIDNRAARVLAAKGEDSLCAGAQ